MGVACERCTVEKMHIRGSLVGDGSLHRVAYLEQMRVIDIAGAARCWRTSDYKLYLHKINRDNGMLALNNFGTLN